MWREENCVIGDEGELIAIWGDSYAGHYFGPLRELATKTGRRLALFGAGSCPPAAGLKLKEWPQCHGFNDMVMERLGKLRPARVLLSGHWLNYEKRGSLLGNDVAYYLHGTIARLREMGIEVVVVGPSPIFPNSAPIIASARSGLAKTGVFYARFSRVFDHFFRDLQTQGQIRYFPTYSVFCNDSGLCRFRNKDALLFWDDGHMTREGADLVVAQLGGDLLAMVRPIGKE
jgi:hypothetical protein